MKKYMKYMMFIGMIVVVSLAVGCAWQESRVAMDYGTSFQLQKYNQTLNTEAEKNLAPVTGVSGQAAQAVVEKHNKGFEKETPTSTSYQINVGSMGGK
jgi:formylglycine-generating enzyme required for sulfatase activity